MGVSMTTPYLRRQRFERIRTVTVWLCLIASVLGLAVVIGLRMQEIAR
jgi:hypothetical protein